MMKEEDFPYEKGHLIGSCPFTALHGCSRAEWSAQDDSETQKAAVAAMLAEGNNANFVTFTLGTTLAEGQTAGSGAGEHMTSFVYAYKLSVTGCLSRASNDRKCEE